MLLTREEDYAIRMMRSMKDREKHTVRDICAEEEVPKAFAYKILRKLQNAGLVKVERGVSGGCRILKELSALSLYDVVTAVDEAPVIMPCMHEVCSRNTEESPCKVHVEMERIQQVLMQELRAKPLSELF